MATSSKTKKSIIAAQVPISKTKLVVGAIDFGTTYSGYAFAFKNDPSKIESNTWKNQSYLSLKTTTSVLFHKGTFHSFGFEADQKYANVLEKEEDKNKDDDDSDSDSDDENDGDENVKDGQKEELIFQECQYFNRFKMKLYREFKTLDVESNRRSERRKITKEMKLKDEQGGSMAAFNVFSSAIEFLKNRLMSSIQSRVQSIVPEDVCWVITIPAIWTDAAKQFMREAAEAAGIDGESLTLALEPEAAAIYCKEVTVQKLEKNECDENELSAFRPGQKFLVLDMGGGTVDITINEVLKNGHLKEIRNASGGPWGGTKVDEEYFIFLKELFGEKVWNDFARYNPSAKFDIENDFEIKKRNLQLDSEYTSIRCPTALFRKYEKVNGLKLSKDLKVEGHKYKTIVKVSGDKLKIKSKFILHFFEESKRHIISHLKSLFQEESVASVDSILMVGGFAESEYMQKEIRNAFPSKKFIVPPEAGLAVLKGAVKYGFNPLIISVRKSPRTYGISVNVPFDEKVHPIKLKCEYDGSEKCSDVFQKMVTIGQSLVVNETVFEHVCHPTRAYDNTANVDVYESLLQNPKYTIDTECKRVGSLNLDIPDVERGKARKIKIKMYFGHTEIFVSAHEEGTSNAINAKFNCLNK